MTLEELNLTEEQLKGVQKLLQSETDKVRTEYSNKIKDLQSKLPVEKTEEQLAYEKEMADFKKEKAQFELSKTLSNKGLNSELSKYLNVDGVEDLETYLSDFSNLLGSNNGYQPNKSNNTTNSNITKEQFNKMNYTERANLYNSNKELYDILSK